MVRGCSCLTVSTNSDRVILGSVQRMAAPVRTVQLEHALCQVDAQNANVPDEPPVAASFEGRPVCGGGGVWSISVAVVRAERSGDGRGAP